MRRILRHIPPVVVALGCGVGGLALADRTMAPTGGQWAALLASLALFVAAAVILLQASREFRRYRTTIWPHGRPTSLLRTGPFRWSRNPLYLGLLLLTLIPFAWTGEPRALLAPVAFFFFINSVTIPFEEDRLRQAFPDDFPRYCREVRRWL